MTRFVRAPYPATGLVTARLAKAADATVLGVSLGPFQRAAGPRIQATVLLQGVEERHWSRARRSLEETYGTDNVEVVLEAPAAGEYVVCFWFGAQTAHAEGLRYLLHLQDRFDLLWWGFDGTEGFIAGAIKDDVDEAAFIAAADAALQRLDPEAKVTRSEPDPKEVAKVEDLVESATALVHRIH